jgi:predicted alpha/beta-fold hydrolase
MTCEDVFRPAWYLRNGHIQTILASSHFRAWGQNPMRDAARQLILTTPRGVRLQGFYSPQQASRPRGLVILLHGWEGSAESTYMLCTGKSLYHRGYDIFRLNFRDHGNSHHLNPSLFYAVLLEEVFQAVQQVAQQADQDPVFMVGFSLGGNFVLRIGRQAAQTPIANLRHVVAISPVLNPAKSTLRSDQINYVRKYFLKKWRQSLAVKQQLFPELYDFSAMMSMQSMAEMTAYLLEKYSDYDSAEEYFRGYTLLNNAISDLALPTTIITAADDPLIPVEDFYKLQLNDQTRLFINDFGGHNGFIDGINFKSWYEQKLGDIFDETGKR